VCSFVLAWGIFSLIACSCCVGICFFST